MEIREAESACVCVGRVRVCLSGKRKGEISARKLSLNKNKNLSVIFTASDVSTIPAAMCQPHQPLQLLNHCIQ